MRARIGLIGFGAIGQDLYARLAAETFAIAVLLRDGSSSRALVPEGATVATTLDGLIAAGPDLVVEAAGQTALRDLVPTLLERGTSVVVASTGALGDADLLRRLTAAARAGGARLIVPSGALGGLDYLAALAGMADARIRYTSRKPPSAWSEELAHLGSDARALRTEVLLFEGSAVDAARLYPRNLNAGLTLALAAGSADLVVRVVADPAVALNTHEIEVESPFGQASMRFANRPAPGNPKTSALTAASLAAAVRRFFEPVVL